MKEQINFLKLICISILLFLLPSCINKNNSGLPEIETETISAIAQTSAISGGKRLSDGGNEITAKGVAWSINNKPTVLDPHSLDGSGDASFVSTLTELTPKTDYHVRAYATNVEGTAYGDDKTLRTLSFTSAGQIIANHTVVDRFDDIPAYYMAEVKKMLLVVAGQSHGLGYLRGLAALESLYSAYDANYTDKPEAYTTSHLRMSRTTWGDVNNATGWINSYGEEDWFETAQAIVQTKTGIRYYNSLGIPMSAFGLGWCWNTIDGEYITPYLSATQSYIDYCTTNSIPTKIFFTTQPVDTYGSGYNTYLLNERIRDYVSEDTTRILFDYADILSYDDGSSVEYTITADGHSFQAITPTNNYPDLQAHISAVGELRLGKAMWWMLARIAGWDGN
jgi:hypothetical protein